MLIATVLGIVEIGVRLRCRNEKTYRLNTDLAQREKLEEHHLEEIDLPNKLFTETMIKDKEMVIGRYVRLGHTLYRGKILDRRDFEHFDEAQEKALLMLEPGEVLLSSEASLVNTGGNILRAGDYVNLSVKIRDFDGNGEVIPLMNGVRVVNVRDRDGIEIEKGKQPSVIGFAIPQKLERIIHKAMGRGTLSVVICSGIPQVINELQKEVITYFDNDL